MRKLEKMKRKIILITMLLVIGFTGCDRDSEVASYNLSKQADMFELDRRVVFYNGINGEYILTIRGRCSINVSKYENQLEVTCKTGNDKFKKHFLGLSDNVTYFAEQLESKDVSVYHYEVVFKPQTIIPDIDFVGSVKDLTKNRN